MINIRNQDILVFLGFSDIVDVDVLPTRLDFVMPGEKHGVITWRAVPDARIQSET